MFATYFAQGPLYPIGSPTSKAVLILILLICGFFFLKTLFDGEEKDSFYKVWTVFLALNVAGFLFTLDYRNPIVFNWFKTVLISLLPFYLFYYLSRHEALKSNHLIQYFIIILPITILQFYFLRDLILSQRSTLNVNVVNNVAYSFVFLMPFVFLFRQRIISLLAMFVLMYFTILGAKRGALITGSLGFLLFCYYHLRTVERKNRFINYLIVITGISLLGYFAYRFFYSYDYFIMRFLSTIEEGHTAGRVDIYTDILNAWYNSGNLINWLLGFGLAGSVTHSQIGSAAHNDWLEMLANFGLLGVVVFAILFYTALTKIRKPDWGKGLNILLLAIIFMWFSTSIYSMSYVSSEFYLYTMVFGFLTHAQEASLSEKPKIEETSQFVFQKAIDKAT